MAGVLRAEGGGEVKPSAPGYKLEGVERDVAELVGRGRHGGDHDGRYFMGDLTPEQRLRNHIEAAGSEIAFCKLFNAFPELTAGFGQVDCTVGATRIDVKYTEHPNGGLLLPAGKDERGGCDEIDVYALMVGTLKDGFRFVGSLKKEVFITPAYLLKDGKDKRFKGDVYFADPEKLDRDIAVEAGRTRLVFVRPVANCEGCGRTKGTHWSPDHQKWLCYGCFTGTHRKEKADGTGDREEGQRATDVPLRQGQQHDVQQRRGAGGNREVPRRGVDDHPPQERDGDCNLPQVRGPGRVG